MKLGIYNISSLPDIFLPCNGSALPKKCDAIDLFIIESSGSAF